MDASDHAVVLTRPDGRGLTPLARVAGAVWLEADYQDARQRFPLHTREGHKKLLGLAAALALAGEGAP